MAAAVFDVVTIAEAVQAACTDVGADVFTADEINAIIGAHVLGSAQTQIYTKYGNYFLAPDGYRGKPYSFMFANETTPFTGQSDCVYDCHSRWGSILITGTYTHTELSISVIPVDFNGIMHTVFAEIAQRRALQVAQNAGTFSYDPSGMIQHLINAASRWLT